MKKQSTLLFMARLILIGSECCIAYSRTAAELDYDIKSCDKNWLINDDAGNVICDPNMARKPMLIAFTSDVQRIKSKSSHRGQMKSKGCKVKEGCHIFFAIEHNAFILELLGNSRARKVRDV